MKRNLSREVIIPGYVYNFPTKKVRKNHKKRGLPHYVFGVDPSNTSTGIACFVLHDGIYTPTRPFSYDPWEVCVPHQMEKVMPGFRAMLFCEQPQNGAHSSRGGVERAAGMAISMLRHHSSIDRKDVYMVKPRAWWEHFERPHGADKQWSLDTCPWELGEDDDAAEAYLIGVYGIEKKLKAMVDHA